jgi:hypothetical protein
MLIWPLAEGSLVAQLAAIQAGNKHPFWFCFLIAIRTGPTLLLANLIMTAAMSAGFLLLILPGLWLYGRFAMLPFVLVLENESPLAALRKSFVRSHAQQWPLLGGMLFFGLLAFSLIDLLGTALASVSFLPGWAAPMLAALAYSLLGALKDVYVFRFYLLSRSSSERVPSNRT